MERKIVEKFLSWDLPADFNPDAGITFEPPKREQWWPIGTNLLDYSQASDMLDHVVGEELDQLRSTIKQRDEEIRVQNDTIRSMAQEIEDTNHALSFLVPLADAYSPFGVMYKEKCEQQAEVIKLMREALEKIAAPGALCGYSLKRIARGCFGGAGS